jgi:hypothetical protein
MKLLIHSGKSDRVLPGMTDTRSAHVKSMQQQQAQPPTHRTTNFCCPSASFASGTSDFIACTPPAPTLKNKRDDIMISAHPNFPPRARAKLINRNL